MSVRSGSREPLRSPPSGCEGVIGSVRYDGEQWTCTYEFKAKAGTEPKVPAPAPL
jgi:hypothetical protein